MQPNLHGAGTVSADALGAMVKHASNRIIRHSAETGCGATTLMLSHLSQHHTVFALDIGGSVANVRRSPLLRKGAVSFIEGPSQRTLPQHHFAEKLQLALIDGPHAYPFPDLKYYFLYPHLDSGALLILDDIQIRSIHNLFEFLRDDAMFRLDEVVRTTVFFTRTAAPTFDPLGDGWRHQGYNGHTLLRHDWRSKVMGVLPRSVLRRLAVHWHRLTNNQSGCSVEILSPHPAQRVAETGIVEGRATISSGAYLWVLVHRKDVDGWWPQGDGSPPVAGNSWTVQVNYGAPEDFGFQFEIAAVLVTRTVHERWLEWGVNNSYPAVCDIQDPSVVKFSGTYYLYAAGIRRRSPGCPGSGNTGNEHAAIYAFSSSDGVSFSPLNCGNPVIQVPADPSCYTCYTGKGIGFPSAVVMGSGSFIRVYFHHSAPGYGQVDDGIEAMDTYDGVSFFNERYITDGWGPSVKRVGLSGDYPMVMTKSTGSGNMAATSSWSSDTSWTVGNGGMPISTSPTAGYAPTLQSDETGLFLQGGGAAFTSPVSGQVNLLWGNNFTNGSRLFLGTGNAAQFFNF